MCMSMSMRYEYEHEYVCVCLCLCACACVCVLASERVSVRAAWAAARACDPGRRGPNSASDSGEDDLTPSERLRLNNNRGCPARLIIFLAASLILLFHCPFYLARLQRLPFLVVAIIGGIIILLLLLFNSSDLCLSFLFLSSPFPIALRLCRCHQLHSIITIILTANKSPLSADDPNYHHGAYSYPLS